MLEFFPIPSLYSDIQQEQFWAVGVRTFGHGLFHYRTSHIGASVTYRVVGFKSPTEKGDAPIQRIETSAPQRIRAPLNHNDQIQAEAELLRQSQSITDWAALSPDSKAMLEFARNLAISSNVEEKFWTDLEAQDDTVDQMQQYLDALTNDPSQVSPSTVLPQLNNILLHVSPSLSGNAH